MFRHISSALKYFASNKLMSFASVGVLAVCLFVVGNFYLISLNLEENIADIERKNEIAIFIEDEATEEDVDTVYAELAEIDNILSVRYVSKEQALTEYMISFKGESAFFDDLKENNPLPQYFSIVLKDIRLFDETVATLENVSFVYKVRSQEEVVDTILSFGNMIRNVSYWVVALMVAAAFFIIINTIRLASFYFRKQINIMKFVGATDWYIRWPFIYQGAIIGILAALLAFGMQWYAYIYIFQSLGSQVQLLTVIPFEFLQSRVLNIFMILGVGVGVLGSGASISKYLNV